MVSEPQQQNLRASREGLKHAGKTAQGLAARADEAEMDKKPSGLAKANTQLFYTLKNRFRSSEGGKAKGASGAQQQHVGPASRRLPERGKEGRLPEGRRGTSTRPSLCPSSFQPPLPPCILPPSSHQHRAHREHWPRARASFFPLARSPLERDVFKTALTQSFPQLSSPFLESESKTKQELPSVLSFCSFSEVHQQGKSLAANSDVLSDYAG